MKNTKRFIAIALSALMLISAFAMTAFAADASINYKGGKHEFTLTPNDTTFTTSDMFGGFKGLMPGDHRDEDIVIHCDPYYADKEILIYMQAVPHGAGNMPVVKDGTQGKSLMTVEEMNELLGWMNLKVYDAATKQLVFNDKASAASESILLGDFLKNKTHDLIIELDVDKNMPNGENQKYENREAEVDWVFTVKEYEKGGGGGGGGGGGSAIKTEPQPEAGVPKTGDNTVIWPYILAVLAAAGIIVAVTVSKKKRTQ